MSVVDDCPLCNTKNVLVDKSTSLCGVCNRETFQPIKCVTCHRTAAYILGDEDDRAHIMCNNCFNDLPVKRKRTKNESE